MTEFEVVRISKRISREEEECKRLEKEMPRQRGNRNRFNEQTHPHLKASVHVFFLFAASFPPFFYTFVHFVNNWNVIAISKIFVL